MPSALPPGDPAPADGSLPESARSQIVQAPLSIYLHVPFCTTRCGYCDFNTYTASELGTAPGASRAGYIESAIAELDLAARVLGPDAPEVSTIFVGGGTPTLLPSADLGRFVTAVRDRFGLAADAEVTTESNPESIDAAGLEQLVEGGFNRISFGMQSVVPKVLQILDRVHSPGRPQAAVAEARAAGFDSVSLDLIYGTPGESMAEWHASLDAALSADPDHVSAYALIVEDGTKLAARIRRGELAMTDDDDHADKYLATEARLTAAGYAAYELSNWARTPVRDQLDHDQRVPAQLQHDHRCRHNLAYWRGFSWWGIGPGAHSHVGGTRWWNVKHPAAYAGRIAEHISPAQAREILSEDDQRVERVLLELRLADGLPVDVLTAGERLRLPDLLRRELIMIGDGTITLTLQGRLLADGVIRDLLD